MTTSAMRLSPIAMKRRIEHRPRNILGVAHGFKMIRIDARAIAAKVVELEPFRDRATKEDIVGAVR